MKDFFAGIKYWVCPEVDKETAGEIDKVNIINIHYTSLVLCVLQLVSVLVYMIAGKADFSDPNVAVPVLSVAASVPVSCAGYIISGLMRRSKDFLQSHHHLVNLFSGAYYGLLVIWSMFISSAHYAHGEQIIIFYAVQMAVVLFVKLQPIFTASMIITSYTAFYCVLNIFFGAGKFNFYNFLVLALISAVGSVINYRLTVTRICQKNKAEKLNESLEIIASHDSITGLQNRYALNKRIGEYLNRDLCVAMGDIDKFKQVNDTYGHHVGDIVLKRFADNLRRHFPAETVFRYGGDEFLIVMPTQDYAAFRKQLEQVNSEFRFLKENGAEINIGCSFGSVYNIPQTTADFFDMILTADQKLYHEKRKIKSNTAKS